MRVAGHEGGATPPVLLPRATVETNQREQTLGHKTAGTLKGSRHLFSIDSPTVQH